jgi:hypothetical protein
VRWDHPSAAIFGSCWSAARRKEQLIISSQDEVRQDVCISLAFVAPSDPFELC